MDEARANLEAAREKRVKARESVAAAEEADRKAQAELAAAARAAGEKVKTVQAEAEASGEIELAEVWVELAKARAAALRAVLGAIHGDIRAFH